MTLDDHDFRFLVELALDRLKVLSTPPVHAQAVKLLAVYSEVSADAPSEYKVRLRIWATPATKIEAIKAIRHLTGMNLSAAKYHMDSAAWFTCKYASVMECNDYLAEIANKGVLIEYDGEFNGQA